MKNEVSQQFLSQETVIMLAIQLFQRLRDLHGIGVIHNDIKPDNLLFDEQTCGTLYLIDFGLSQYYLDVDPLSGKIVNKPKQ